MRSTASPRRGGRLQLAKATAPPPEPVGAFDAEQALDGIAAEALAEEGMAVEPPPEAAATEPAQAR